MPEGPEARTFADQLRKHFINKCLINIFRTGDSAKHNAIANFDSFNNCLPATVKTIWAVGKKVIWHLQTLTKKNYYIIISLGLTGKFVFENSKGCDFGWEFVSRLDNSSTGSLRVHSETLYFLDVRHHGQIYLLENKEQLETFLSKKVGIDLLDFIIRENDDNFEFKDYDSLKGIRNREELLAVWIKQASGTRRQNWEICNFMMKQEIFAGIGNYIKAESLGFASISPHRTLAEMTGEDHERLLNTILDILFLAYEQRGATLRDFHDLSGEKGDYQCQFYGKKSIKIENRIYEIIKEQTSDKRTTHWCPELQD